MAGQFGAGDALQHLVREAQTLAFPVLFLCEGSAADGVFIPGDVLEFMQKPQVDFGDVVDFLRSKIPLQGFIDDKQTLVVAHIDLGPQFLVGELLQLGQGQAGKAISAPRTALWMALSKFWAMAITSPVAFIWVPSRRLA